MKKILCFLSRNDYMALEAVIDYAKEGDEILFLGCDKTVGICHENDAASSIRCMWCRRNMGKKVREFKEKYPYYKIRYTSVSKEVTDDIVKKSEGTSFNYSGVSDIKVIQYKGVNIGYAAFSDYVSCTRNVMPSFNKYFHKYIDFNLRKGMILTDVVEQILSREQFDLVIFHNGRFVNVKPLYDIARKMQINYVATELCGDTEGWRKKDNYENGSPFSPHDCRMKMEQAWERVGEEGVKIGQDFYNKRYSGILAGDKKVYTKDQVKGQLPEGFDINKRNIAIFNSSEDEFVAISKEIDNGMLFPNQYEALKTIFNHYRENSNIHFYLRIHPNLMDVPYRSHTALYELQFPNVTIIPPDSPISTYTLMENSEKVIVFNSTMGVESTYWGKPVIGLNHCVFDLVWHMPSNTEDLYSLIDNPGLLCNSNKTNCYKIACYLLGYHADKFKYYPTYRKLEHLCGRDWYTLSQFKLFGSPVLATAVERLIYFVSRKILHDAKFPENIAEMTK